MAWMRFRSEVGDFASDDQIYRLTFDGSVADEHGYVAMGGSADNVDRLISQTWHSGLSLSEALNIAVTALSVDNDESGNYSSDMLEVGILDRNREVRKFRRLASSEVTELLASK